MTIRILVLLMLASCAEDDMAAPSDPDVYPSTFQDMHPGPRAPTMASTRRLYVYGDSIMAGELASTPALGAVELVRARCRGVFVTNNSASGRPLYLVAGTAGQRSALVALVVANQAAMMWIELGVNDWVLSGADGRTNLTEYTTIYPLLLDALHVALPNLLVFVQSPTLYTGTDPNGAGETLQQYRDAGQAACVGRFWCTYIDGLPILAAGDLAPDHVHPVNSGHAKLATVMVAAIGGGQ